MPQSSLVFRTLLLLCLVAASDGTAQVADSTRRKDTLSGYYRYFSQTTSHISILTGYNGGVHSFFELGVAANTKGRVGYHPLATAYYASSECRIDQNNFIIGPKIGCWYSGGVMPISMGLSMIWYSDFTSSSLRLRPEAGIGMDNFKLTYGYNAALTNRRFQGIDKHLISLQVLIGVKKTAEHNEEASDEWKRRAYPDTAIHRRYSGIDTGLGQHRLMLVGGINGWLHTFGEIGFGYDQQEDDVSLFVSLSEEILIGATRRDGTKFTQVMRAGKGVQPVFGYSLIAYTDYSKMCWALRPIGGVEFKRISLMYGYNWFFDGRAFSEIAPHNISLAYRLCLKRFKDS